MAVRMNLPRDQVQDNLLAFEVYYRDMVEEQIINEIAYNPFDLFCDIGGALGLILGKMNMNCSNFLKSYQIYCYTSDCQ